MSSTTHHEMHLTDMGHQCDYCQGRSFRRSRLKVTDLGPLLVLHYPVRCLSCSQRQSVNLLVALRSVSSSVKQVRISRSTANPVTKDIGHEVERPIGGGSFPVVRAQQPVAMPDLRGIVLEHHTAVQHKRPRSAARSEPI